MRRSRDDRGRPPATVTPRSNPISFIAICPWSWYIVTTPWNSPRRAATNRVSAGSGPIASRPSARNRSTAGAMVSISSLPSSPPSPACGFSPATAIFGAAMPDFATVRCSRRAALRILSTVRRPATSAKARVKSRATSTGGRTRWSPTPAPCVRATPRKSAARPGAGVRPASSPACSTAGNQCIDRARLQGRDPSSRVPMVYSPAIRLALAGGHAGAASPIGTISARARVSGSASSFRCSPGRCPRDLRQQANPRLHAFCPNSTIQWHRARFGSECTFGPR